MTLRSLSTIWNTNTPRWEMIITKNLLQSSKSSIMREQTSSEGIRKKLKTYSISTKKSKLSTSNRGKRMKRTTEKNLKMSWVRTPTNRMSKRSSLKLRCKFLRNVWRTWRLYTHSTKRNLNSTMRFFSREKVSTKRWWRFFRTDVEEQRLHSLR